MSAIEDAVNDINATIEAERAEVAARIQEQADRITELEAQVARGEAVTLEQLAGIKAGVQGIYKAPA